MQASAVHVTLTWERMGPVPFQALIVAGGEWGQWQGHHLVPLIMGWEFSATSQIPEQPLPAGFEGNIPGQYPALCLCVKIISGHTQTPLFDLIICN